MRNSAGNKVSRSSRKNVSRGNGDIHADFTKQHLPKSTQPARTNRRRADFRRIMFDLFKRNKIPKDLSKVWIWITVNDRESCQDCKKRHGEIKTMNKWESLGLPGSGKTKCGDSCRCLMFRLDLFKSMEHDCFKDDPKIMKIIDELREREK